jgi:hypothetical protein
MHGKGTERHINGNKYKGEFICNKKNGLGEAWYLQKYYFKGEFRNGKMVTPKGYIPIFQPEERLNKYRMKKLNDILKLNKCIKI